MAIGVLQGLELADQIVGHRLRQALAAHDQGHLAGEPGEVAGRLAGRVATAHDDHILPMQGRRPGALGNTDMVRIMDPTASYPEGYLRYYNNVGGGQPLDALGKPGDRAATHISLDDQSGLPGYYAWLEQFR